MSLDTAGRELCPGRFLDVDVLKWGSYGVENIADFSGGMPGLRKSVVGMCEKGPLAAPQPIGKRVAQNDKPLASRQFLKTYRRPAPIDKCDKKWLYL